MTTNKHPRDGVTLSLSLSLGDEEAERGGARIRKQPRRRGGEEFVCKTCSRAFASFQALGGHRTSHLRGRHHGLALGTTTKTLLLSPPNNNQQLDDAAATTAAAHDDEKKEKPAPATAAHECHFCGAAFEMGQALGGHMRRHRDEVVVASKHQAPPPVLLQLFV